MGPTCQGDKELARHVGFGTKCKMTGIISSPLAPWLQQFIPTFLCDANYAALTHFKVGSSRDCLRRCPWA